ncbi:glycoside hydrolase family 3 C-terminal domain-containing protein [Streptomyces sp. NPDC005774]|uniref:glycoside hydrolase family 3 C-terminal domain-containing protein n=1 Tax=Streptomyces sp. NPDC005774 TaxID=3364728 RepID=UPI0036BC570E
MGTALAAVLFGDSDPSGRLPVTFPADATQGPGGTPATYPGRNGAVTYDEGIAVGYRYYDAKGQQPRFPFRTRPVLHLLRPRHAGSGLRRNNQEHHPTLTIG